jgi:hypothetical protein
MRAMGRWGLGVGLLVGVMGWGGVAGAGPTAEAAREARPPHCEVMRSVGPTGGVSGFG